MEQVVFAQITDAHIGHRLMSNRMWRLQISRDIGFDIPFLRGYNPHDSALLEPLRVALDDARSICQLDSDEHLRVVLGGDLTAGGTFNDFALANGLFFRRWRWYKGVAPPLDRSIGLRFLDEDVVSVPGNHDHWQSDWFQTAVSPMLFPHFFQQTPWQHRWLSRSKLLVVQLFGVDSNSGMTGRFFNNNLPAGGSLSSVELRSARQLLEHSSHEMDNGASVRVMICHHAFDRGNSAAAPLASESRRYLSYLASDYRVPVVLTGHTHEPDIVRWSESGSSDPNWQLHEFRSGAALAGPANGAQSAFWVHRIRLNEGSGRPIWTAWKYQTYGKEEFELDDPRGTYEFEVPE